METIFDCLWTLTVFGWFIIGLERCVTLALQVLGLCVYLTGRAR